MKKSIRKMAIVGSCVLILGLGIAGVTGFGKGLKNVKMFLYPITTNDSNGECYSSYNLNDNENLWNDYIKKFDKYVVDERRKDDITCINSKSREIIEIDRTLKTVRYWKYKNMETFVKGVIGATGGIDDMEEGK